MKRITILLIAAFLIAGLSANSQKVTTDALVGITEVKPKNDMTSEQFESFYLDEFLPVLNKELPSVPMVLMKTIQGKRMDEYAEFYTFKSLEERSKWFPKPGVTTEEWKKVKESMGETWSKAMKVISNLEYTDYTVLPFAGKNIDVKKGNVVIVFKCELTPEEGMTYEELEEFYQKKYVPAYIKNFPGTQFCVLKGDRGDRTGKYTELMVYDSMEEYNNWVTKDGRSSEKTKQAFKNMGEVQAKMEKMYTYSRAVVYIVL